MRSVLTLAAFLAGLAPASAQACSFCVDTTLLRWSWWITGLHFLTGVLFVECLVHGILRRVLKQPQRGRARWLLLGLGLAITFWAGYGGSGYALSFGFGVGLAIRFALSVREDLPLRPRQAWARVALVVLLVALGVFSSRPAARPTTWLVGMLDSPFHRDPAPAHLIPSSWGVRELARREDAPAALLARLARFEPDPPEHHRARAGILRLLRAHSIAGGDPSARRAECQRLGVSASWGELMQSAHAQRVCGTLAEPLAAAKLP